MRHGSGILAVIRHLVLNLAGGDPRDHDGTLVGVSRTPLAFGASWRRYASNCPCRRRMAITDSCTPVVFFKPVIALDCLSN